MVVVVVVVVVVIVVISSFSTRKIIFAFFSSFFSSRHSEKLQQLVVGQDSLYCLEARIVDLEIYIYIVTLHTEAIIQLHLELEWVTAT